MKIMYVTDQEGGAYNYMESVMIPASELGHEVLSLDAREIQPPNYSQYGLNMKLEEFENALKEFDPDIVHVFNFCLWGENIFARLKELGIPAVLSMPDYALVCKNRMFFKGPFTALCDTTAMHTDCENCADFCLSIKTERKQLIEKMRGVKIIVGSSVMKDIFCEYGYPEEQIDIIELGIDPSKYTYSDKFGSDTIINLNRMAHEKGIDIYDRIARDNGKHKWLIAGSPRLGDDFIASLKKAEYIGKLSEKRKVEVLRNADIFCSTPRWFEPIGITYLEAKACGRPVVTWDVGGLRQYHGDGNPSSRVVGFGDTGAISACIDELLSDENEMRRMGKAGRHQIEGRQNQYNLIHDNIRVYDELRGTR